jgi:hypothetical protein
MALVESLSRSQFLLVHDSLATLEAKPQAKPEGLLLEHRTGPDLLIARPVLGANSLERNLESPF